MANAFPASVKARLAASGSGAQVSLFELLTIQGNRFYWSDATITAATGLASILYVHGGGSIRETLVYPPADFKPWLLSAGPFNTYRSTQTGTGSVKVQNLSGDTVRRDGSQIFAANGLAGSIVCYRLWMADAEYATFTFYGTVDAVDLEADGESFTLHLEERCSWSRIDAPYAQIGPSCPLTFGSVQCGALGSSPCNNDYGSCQSVERYMGVIQEWVGAAVSTQQFVQPEPIRLANPRVQ